MEKTKTAVLGLVALINAGKIDEDVLVCDVQEVAILGRHSAIALASPCFNPMDVRATQCRPRNGSHV